MKKERRLLNIGCGRHFHPDWINIDLVPQDAKVLQCDTKSGLPFQNDSFEFCYSSHVLEHLNQGEAVFFLAEQLRVLKKNGIIRVVVPDLEGITRNYLRVLEESTRGSIQKGEEYDWMILELLDQMVRTTPGGEMINYLATTKSRDFVRARVGEEADYIWRTLEEKNQHWLKRMQRFPLNILVRRLYLKLISYVLYPLGMQASQIFDEAVFRGRGEIHLWMYDRFSLPRLLKNVGFSEIKVVFAHESYLPDFANYYLDTNADGLVRKPDSLFVEALKQ